MFHPEDQWTTPRRTSRRVAPRLTMGADAGAAQHGANLLADNQHTINIQRDWVAHLREHVRARLADLAAELVDATQALDEAHAEQDLGLACFALGALQARRDKCATAMLAAQAELATLDLLHDTLATHEINRATATASAA